MKAMRDSHIVAGKPEDGEKIGLLTRKRMEEQVKDLVQLKLIQQLIPIDKFVRFDLLPADLQSAAK
jgi:hypothetical protein